MIEKALYEIQKEDNLMRTLLAYHSARIAFVHQ